MRCQLQPRLLVMRYGGSGLRAAVHVLFVLASHLLGGTPLVCVACVQLDPLVPLRAATSHLLTRVINPMRAVHETCARRMDVRNVRVLSPSGVHDAVLLCLLTHSRPCHPYRRNK